MNCLLDRNDEVYRKVAEKCLTPTDDLLKDTKNSCNPTYEADDSLSLTIDTYSNDYGPIAIEISGPAQFRSPYLAGPSHLTAWFGDTCEADGSNEVSISAPRICEDLDVGPADQSIDEPSCIDRQKKREAWEIEAYLSDIRVQVIVDSLAEFLGEDLPIFEVFDEHIKSDYDIITTLPTLSAMPGDERQTYPTDFVKEFFKGIDFNKSIEQITFEFKQKLKKLNNYEHTTLDLRKKKAPSLFVCQRSAHEIIASTYMFGCGEFAVLFLSLMKAAGKEARLVKVVKDNFKEKGNDAGHDLVEVLDEETWKWILVDPTFGTVHRKYDGEPQFRHKDANWIRIGEWNSNWSAGCFTKRDNTAMRSWAMNTLYDSTLPFVDIDDPDMKPAGPRRR